MRGAAVFLQAGRAALLVASPPLAHGERAGAEEPGGGLDAALADRGDQPQAVIVGASHFTNQIEVADEHRAAILAARAARLLPPPPGGATPNTIPTPFVASDSHTTIPPRGNDVPFLFQKFQGIDRLAETGESASNGDGTE